MHEHDSHSSALIRGNFDEKEYTAKLAEKISCLDHQLKAPGEAFNQAKIQAAAAVKVQELERLKRTWDDVNSKFETQETEGPR